MAYNEIRRTTSKRDSICGCGCGKQVKKGSECMVDPKNKKVYIINHEVLKT